MGGGGRRQTSVMQKIDVSVYRLAVIYMYFRNEMTCAKNLTYVFIWNFVTMIRISFIIMSCYVMEIAFLIF